MSKEKVSTSQPISAPKLSKKMGGQILSMQILRPLNFPFVNHKQGLKYHNFSANISVNKNLLDFYSDYPYIDIWYYARSPISQSLAEQLKNTIGKQIENKETSDALQWILSLVQHAFQYKTDGEQFGREKPFFVEEMFFHPFSDCEDRAILFTWLVKNLLNLDVVLLKYPNHLAAAVDTKNLVIGNYISYKNRRYIICDPTYKGGRIGEFMPQYKGVSPEVWAYY